MLNSKYILNSTVRARTPALAFKEFKKMNMMIQVLYDHLGSEMLEEDVPIYGARDFIIEGDGQPANTIDGFARFTLILDEEHVPYPSGFTYPPDRIQHVKRFAQNSLAYGIQNGMQYHIEYSLFWEKAMQWYYICEEIGNESMGFDIRADSELMTLNQWQVLRSWLQTITGHKWYWNVDIRMWQKDTHAASRLRITDVQQMVADHESAAGPPPF